MVSGTTLIRPSLVVSASTTMVW